MAISRSDVEHVAKLCRLALSRQELETMSGELARMLEYMEKLKELDVGGVEPTMYGLDGNTPLREDVPGAESLPRADVLKAAPEEKDGHFKVPGAL